MHSVTRKGLKSYHLRRVWVSLLARSATLRNIRRELKAEYALSEELSKEYEGIGFGKVDIDDNQDAAAAFQISSVPTFIFFNGQKPFKAFAGADKAQLESVVKELDQA